MKKYTKKQMLRILQDYFKRQLFEGNYTLISVTMYNAWVEVEGETFNLWIANDKYAAELNTSLPNAIHLDFSCGEKALLWKSIETHILPSLSDEERERKAQLLTRLTNELQS